MQRDLLNVLVDQVCSCWNCRSITKQEFLITYLCRVIILLLFVFFFTRPIVFVSWGWWVQCFYNIACLESRQSISMHCYCWLRLGFNFFFFSLCWWLYRSDCGVAVDLNVLRVEILRSLHRKCVCWLVSMSVSVQVPFTMSKMPHLHETGVCELAHVDCGRIQNSASRIFHSVWRTRQKNTSPL